MPVHAADRTRSKRCRAGSRRNKRLKNVGVLISDLSPQERLDAAALHRLTREFRHTFLKMYPHYEAQGWPIQTLGISGDYTVFQSKHTPAPSMDLGHEHSRHLHIDMRRRKGNAIVEGLRRIARYFRG